MKQNTEFETISEGDPGPQALGTSYFQVDPGPAEKQNEVTRLEMELELERAYSRGLYDCYSDAVAVLGRNGSVAQVNQKFTELFGFEEAEATGRKLSELLAPAEKEANSPETPSFGWAKRQERVAERVHKDGSVLQVAIVGSPVEIDGRVVGSIVSYRAFVQRRSPSLSQEPQRDLALFDELRAALARGEFLLEYQPQFDLKTDLVVGVEALLRWQHPQRGLLYPKDFLGEAEASGLILEIGNWVLWEACLQRKDWADGGLGTFPVSINVSPAQLRDSDFALRLLRLIDGIGLSPDLLQLEITENLLMDSSGVASRSLKLLQEKRVLCCIDDFGTGYSSLRNLRSLPFHKLKIAGEFVRGVSKNSEQAAIVDAIVRMSRNLDLTVVAEGVESSGEVAFLRECGCDQVQGFYFSASLAPEDFVRLITT